MKIVLIGPSSAVYKGGIAHFTSCLAAELRRHCDLLFVSWYQLYPQFLSTRNFQDNASKVSIGDSEAEFLLGYWNPFSWIKTIFKIRKYMPDKVVLAWVHPVHAPIYIFMILFLRLFCKAEIVLQCHNVRPHEVFLGADLLSKIVFKIVHRLSVHSASEKTKAESIVRGKEITQIFHPIYEFPDEGKAVAIEKDAKIQLLFFGVIREYKGLDLLFLALKELIPNYPDIHLQVAGEAFEKDDNKKVFEMVTEAGLVDFVSLDIRYIPNEEVASFFKKADVVVLPYRSATSSGPLSIAYHFAKPVIATRVGGLPDYVEDGKSGYLCEVSYQSIAQVIEKFIEQPLSSEEVNKVARSFSWERYVKLLIAS